MLLLSRSLRCDLYLLSAIHPQIFHNKFISKLRYFFAYTRLTANNLAVCRSSHLCNLQWIWYEFLLQLQLSSNRCISIRISFISILIWYWYECVTIFTIQFQFFCIISCNPPVLRKTDFIRDLSHTVHLTHLKNIQYFRKKELGISYYSVGILCMKKGRGVV